MNRVAADPNGRPALAQALETTVGGGCCAMTPGVFREARWCARCAIQRHCDRRQLVGEMLKSPWYRPEKPVWGHFQHLLLHHGTRRSLPQRSVLLCCQPKCLNVLPSGTPHHQPVGLNCKSVSAGTASAQNAFQVRHDTISVRRRTKVLNTCPGECCAAAYLGSGNAQ